MLDLDAEMYSWSFLELKYKSEQTYSLKRKMFL